MRHAILTTNRRSVGPDRRVTPEHRRTCLLSMGFTHVVVDVVGSIQSASTKKCDADAEATRLNNIYGLPDAFVVEQL